MTKCSMRVPLVLLSVLLSGCGDARDAADAAPSLTVVQGIVFEGGEDEGALSRIWDVDVSADGHVFASEPQAAHVVVFSPGGSYGRTIGRRGQGPGEFQVPGNMAWRGDTLVVFDFQTGGNLFSVEGEYLGVVSFKRQTADNPWFGAMPIFLLANGDVMGFAPVPNSAVLDGERTQQAWLRLTREGDLLDTLALQRLVGQDVEVDLGQRSFRRPHPFASTPLIAVPPDASFVVMVDRDMPGGEETPSFRIHRIGLGGDTAVSQDMPYSPIELLDSEIDSVARGLAAPQAERYELTEDRVASLIRSQIPWPRYRPPVTAVLAASDGSVWLRREFATGDSIRWDVTDAQLQPVGFVYLPIAFDVKVMTEAGPGSPDPGWNVYGVVLDDFDVPSIVQYRVLKP